ncbi:hypothetical protein [Halospeciosus flavus]
MDQRQEEARVGCDSREHREQPEGCRVATVEDEPRRCGDEQRDSEVSR